MCMVIIGSARIRRFSNCTLCSPDEKSSCDSLEVFKGDLPFVAEFIAVTLGFV